jgi:hypothetical protein
MLRTMTTSLPDTLRRGLRWAAAALALGVLVACGPGTGGTGTGPLGPFSFSGSAGSVSAPALGSACTGTACGGGALVLADEKIELVVGCRRFVRTDEWEVGANGLLEVSGGLDSVVASSMAAPATLRLQFSGPTADSGQVTATVTDRNGQVVLGPVTLQRDPQFIEPRPAAGCVPG